MKNKRTVLCKLIIGIALPVYLLLPLTSIAFDSEKVTIGFKQESLEKVLLKIEDAFKVDFTYDPSIFRDSDKINLIKKKRSLSEVLGYLSEAAGLKFMQAGNLIGVQKLANEAKSSPIQLSVINRRYTYLYGEK